MQPVVALAADFSGSYVAKGVNPDGGAYSGTAEIKRVRGDLYDITWTLPEGVDVGVCIGGEGVMSCGYRRVGQAARKAGVIVYSVNVSGKFVGRWADEGFTKIARETLTLAR